MQKEEDDENGTLQPQTYPQIENWKESINLNSKLANILSIYKKSNASPSLDCSAIHLNYFSLPVGILFWNLPSPRCVALRVYIMCVDVYTYERNIM